MKFNILGLTISLTQIITPIIYIIVGIVIFQILKRLVNRISQKKGLKITQQQRIRTITMLLTNIVKYIIIIIVLLGILSVFGFFQKENMK